MDPDEFQVDKAEIMVDYAKRRWGAQVNQLVVGSTNPVTLKLEISAGTEMTATNLARFMASAQLPDVFSNWLQEQQLVDLSRGVLPLG